MEDTMNDFEDILFRGSKALHFTLGEREYSRFRLYHDELIFWNRKMSLVSVKTPLDLPVKHFIDSLAVLPFIDKKARALLDIGSGAGFPGLPIKIAMTSLSVTLVDASRKKTSFLKHIIRKLCLDDVSVINGRIDTLAEQEQYRESFDIVISRASFKLPRFLELSTPFVTRGGTLIAMKGPNIKEEQDAADSIAKQLGVSVTECHSVTLPLTGDKRSVLLFRKISS